MLPSMLGVALEPDEETKQLLDKLQGLAQQLLDKQPRPQVVLPPRATVESVAEEDDKQEEEEEEPLEAFMDTDRDEAMQ